MGTAALLVVCLVLAAIGLYNLVRSWRWTEFPETLEGREHWLPTQCGMVVFFSAFPVAIVLDAILGHPADGSGGAVVVGVVGVVIAVAGVALAASAYWLGRPQRVIPPIARDLPRWAPQRSRR